MEKTRYFRVRSSKMHFFFWTTLMVGAIMIYYFLNIQSEFFIPIVCGILGGQLGLAIALSVMNYKIRDNKLIDTNFGNKSYDLKTLQSIQVKDNSFLDQIMAAKPSQTLKLQFKSAIPRHGQVELWNTDPQLIAELSQFTETELSDNSIQSV